MRVAINLLYVDPRTCGGIGVYATRLMQALAEADRMREYILLLREENQSLFRNLTGFNLTHLVMQPGEALGAYSARLRALRPDVIHHPMTIINPRFDVPAPVVLSFFDLQHEYYPEYFSRAELDFRAKSYRPSVDTAARVVTSSLFTIGTLQEKYATDPAKCTAVYCGIDTGRWQPADAGAVAAAREKFKLPQTFVVYPANPWPHKNHDRLFMALADLRARHGLSVPLVLTGHLDGYECDIGGMAAKHGVRELVHDLGLVPVEDMPALYTAASGLVFPSLFEGGGSFAMLEAMSCQLPMACGAATSTPEVVGDAAILFDPLDVRSMADAMHRLMTDDGLRAALVTRGLSRLAGHTHHGVARQVMRIYDEVAAGWAAQQRSRTEMLTVQPVTPAEVHAYCERVLAVDRSTEPLFTEDMLGQWLVRGEEAFRDGRYDEASLAFHRIHAAVPDIALANNNLGVLFMQLGDPVMAKKYLARALQIDPADANAAVNYRAVCHVPAPNG